MRTHSAARSQQNPTYPQRFPVSDEMVPWSVPFSAYKPTSYTYEGFKGRSFADTDDPSQIAGLRGRLTYEPAGMQWDPSTPSVPLNPIGRTGMCERGRLARWGPNHAADPIVTRFEPATGELQLVVIKRSDTGAWALPGGMVDPGEAVSTTVRREFDEEAGALQDPQQRARFTALADQLFATGGEVVYRGYVDDPRNTDNSWMETCAIHFHCSDELGKLLPLEAGDDAVHVKWVRITPDLELYASHKDWVDVVAETMGQRRPRKQERGGEGVRNQRVPRVCCSLCSVCIWVGHWVEERRFRVHTEVSVAVACGGDRGV